MSIDNVSGTSSNTGNVNGSMREGEKYLGGGARKIEI